MLSLTFILFYFLWRSNYSNTGVIIYVICQGVTSEYYTRDVVTIVHTCCVGVFMLYRSPTCDTLSQLNQRLKKNFVTLLPSFIFYTIQKSCSRDKKGNFVLLKNEALSRNHFCCKKAISIKYYVYLCMFVRVCACIFTFFIRHSNSILPAPYYIVISGLSGCNIFYTSHK